MSLNIYSQLDLSQAIQNQILYSTQLYKTFLQIYGNFECSFNPDKLKYTINGGKLGAINYKGFLNLGITRSVIFSFPNPDDLQINDAILAIEIQAAPSFNPEHAKPIEFIDKEIELIKNKSQLRIIRVVKRLHNRSHQEHVQYQNVLDNIFDEEFEFREGISPSSRRARATNTRPAEWSIIEDMIDKRDPEKVKIADTIACPRRELTIV